MRPGTSQALLAALPHPGPIQSAEARRVEEALTRLLLDDLGAVVDTPETAHFLLELATALAQDKAGSPAQLADQTPSRDVAPQTVRAEGTTTRDPGATGMAAPPSTTPHDMIFSPELEAYLDFGTRLPGPRSAGDARLKVEMSGHVRADDPRIWQALSTRLPDPLVAARLAHLLPAATLRQVARRLSPATITWLQRFEPAFAALVPDAENDAAHVVKSSFSEAALGHSAHNSSDPISCLADGLELLAWRTGQQAVDLLDASRKAAVPSDVRITLDQLQDRLTQPPLAVPALLPDGDVRKEARPMAPDDPDLQATQGLEADPIYPVQTAGLVLLSPYIETLFDRLGLTADGAFADPAAAHKAAHLLGDVATGGDALPDTGLALAKVLCGLPPATALLPPPEPDADRQDLIEGLLKAVCLHWSPMATSGVDGLRVGFLMRSARLQLDLPSESWRLDVDPAPQDILLKHLPWTFEMLRLPWMTRPVKAQWL